MKLKSVSLLLIWVLLGGGTACAEEPTPSTLHLKLEEAVRVALVKSPRIKQVLARLRIAQEQVEIAAAPSRPVVSFNGEIGRVQPAQTPTVPASLSGVQGNFQTDPSFSFTTLEGRFSLRQLLYDGGLVANRIAAARLNAESTEFTALHQWRTLHTEIQAAYINVLMSQQLISNAEATVELAQKNLHTAEKRFEVGQVPRGDIIQAQVPLAQAQLELEQAKFQHRSNKEQLLLLLGLPQDLPLTIDDLQTVPPLELSMEEAVEKALARRYDFLAAQAEAEAAGKELRAAHKEDDPRLSLTGSLDPIGFDGSSIAPGGYRVALRLEWPIFNGNIVEHQIKKAEAQQDLRLASLDQKRQEVVREVREAYRAVEAARIAKDSTQLQFEGATESVRVAQGQYRAGLANFLAVNQQQRDLVRARAAQTQSVYDYLLARARLDLAMGADVLADLQLAQGSKP